MATNLNNGFLLTRQSQDVKSGINITLWLKTQQGPVKLEILNELALFFVENEQVHRAIELLQSSNINVHKVTALSLKTFNQQNVSGFYFNYMRELYAARDCLKHHHIKCYEDDFRPDDRYLMERFITAGIDFVGEYQVEKQIEQKSLHPKAASQCPSYLHIHKAKCKPRISHVALSMVSIDIECSMAGDLYSIGFYSDKCQLVYMIGTAPQKNHCHGLNVDVEIVEDTEPCSQENGNPSVEQDFIVWLDDEQQLLNHFIGWIQTQDPDIIIGWNVINFDMNLLQQRCDKYGIKFAIGRDGTTPYWRKNKSSEQKFLEIAGRVVLDGIDLLKSATYSFPSFSLDYVANSLLGRGKKVDDVENRIDEINYNFHHNKPALARYNLEDCRLVWLIFEKTQLLDFSILRSQLTGLALDRVGGSVAAFTNLYLPKLHRSGYVAPNMGDGESGLVSPGGFVMDSMPGLYKNVLVLDFKSLYPSIIKTFKIDPMGLIEGLLEKSKPDSTAIEGFDGAYFSREQHFLPNIIESLWSERDKAKVEKNAALSQAIKIIMNSFYGVLGSTGCRFFDPRLSGSITKRSHQLLKTTKCWIEAKGYQVIYGDTDSIFVHIGADKTVEQSQRLGIELQHFINKRWREVLHDDYQVQSELEIEFETHFSQFLMPTIRGAGLKGLLNIGTKKRYAGLVQVGEKQTLIFKGMETVRSDWTDLSKVFQQELYRLVFNKEDVEDYIKDIVARTYQGEFDHQLIYRKRLRRQLDEYVKNVPPHVKAARFADNINQELGKPLKYQRKGWIEYLITLDGAQAKECQRSPLDYDFYVERQLQAVADDILPFIGTSFSQIVDKQLGLF